jgi:NAD(P)-dependent dehydrogenase (short-subunit alcohol dehydrogenase family)
MRKAKDAAERIEAEVPKAQLHLTKLDLAEFDSVREFGEHLRQRYGTGSLDLLVNNAGIMALPKRTLSSQGLELQIATNYFGPFLLTALLFPLMKEEEGSRIVTVSSTVARSARLVSVHADEYLLYQIFSFVRAKLRPPRPAVVPSDARRATAEKWGS